ncbi:hypothetical protein ABVT39_001773, partial [Epinephelus coioides]
MYEVSDPALWGEVSENARAVLIDRGPAAFHNRTSRYPASTRDGGLGGKVRSFTNDLLYIRLQTGEKVSRDWITYSPSIVNKSRDNEEEGDRKRETAHRDPKTGHKEHPETEQKSRIY